MSALLLQAENLGKSYPATGHAAQKVSAMFRILAGKALSSEHSIEVLRNVDMSVRAGQSIGIIGENGAGKSTLLKLLSGVIRPTTGSLRRHGSMAALIELSAGFDMTQNGYDNIFLKTALLGMSRRQTRERLDEIIAFADIGEALYQPVKTYSSGMVVRLGFAIVAIQNPQLLMTDEVLAVGDESFQRKCVHWLDQYLANGGTLLMVSHSMYQIKRLCPKALWVHKHQVAMQGASEKVISAYLDWHAEKEQTQEQDAVRTLNPNSYQVMHMRLLNRQGEPIDELQSGEFLRIEMQLHSPDGRKPQAAFGIIEREGLPVYGITSGHAASCGRQEHDGSWRYRVDFPSLPLLPSRYIIRSHVMDPEGIRLCDSMELHLYVRGDSLELGSCRIEHHWY